MREFGADEAYATGELEKRLAQLLRGRAALFWARGVSPAVDRCVEGALAASAAAGRRHNAPAHPPIIDPRPRLAEMRQIKRPEEVELLREAAAATAAGHRAAMAAAGPGLAEYDVQAHLEAAFRRAGSPRTGYPSIVASGANACVLHYIENDRRLRRGELLLVDAGAEVGLYTADVTRTFPVGGTFSPVQRSVYSLVLAAQKAAIAAVRPGVRWDAPHRRAVRVLTRGLVAMRVLKGDVVKLIEKGAYRRFYMHGTSHWLGLDVHDVGAYVDDGKKPVRLRPGMVLTVEPGLYFSPRDRSVRGELRGIGVRIEDDVLVTRGGREVLTSAVPKEIAALEAACRNGTAAKER
jgi:Xaa-Pro aminopeptidase